MHATGGGVDMGEGDVDLGKGDMSIKQNSCGSVRAGCWFASGITKTDKFVRFVQISVALSSAISLPS